MQDKMSELSTNESKRLLMIACAFPPVGGAGVQRTQKFAKYLARLGWKPIVICADSVPGIPADHSLLDDLPESIVRCPIPAIDPETPIRRLLAPFAKLARRSPTWSSKLDGLAHRAGNVARGLLDFGVPDAQVFWAIRAYRCSLRLARTHKAQAIFSTYSPASNHLLAYWLQRKLHIPWIADFRDLWVDDCEYEGRAAWRRWIDGKWQRRFLQSADAVTAVSNGQRDLLASYLPDARAKFHTITNGFDEEDFASQGKINRRNSLSTDTQQRNPYCFTLTFVGQFRSTRVTSEYFKGIAKFVHSDPRIRQKFLFKIVGQISQKMQDRIARLGIPLRVTGYLSHDQAISHLQSADLLLLSTARGANAASVIPGKLFEYLRSGRPILTIGNRNSEAVRIIQHCNAGIDVPRSVARVSDALHVYFRAWTNGQMPQGCSASVLSQYSREKLAQRLDAILANLLGLNPAIKEIACLSTKSPAHHTQRVHTNAESHEVVSV